MVDLYSKLISRLLCDALYATMIVVIGPVLRKIQRNVLLNPNK